MLSLTSGSDIWLRQEQKGYTIYYTANDHNNIEDYKIYFDKGKMSVTTFFQSAYPDQFDVYIHPDRISLDSTWQKDWNMPGFKSQCWMVASGVADKLDIISPKRWDSLACEHTYSNSTETKRLITHELVHVYHGQQNVSPDFSDVTGIDWFVEGLATYASGQCDSIRINEVKKAVVANEIPTELNKFWTGNLRYGLSGTVVMYLDKRYGRDKLVSLLEYNSITELMDSLETTESDIIAGWKNYLNEF